MRLCICLLIASAACAPNIASVQSEPFLNDEQTAQPLPVVEPVGAYIFAERQILIVVAVRNPGNVVLQVLSRPSFAKVSLNGEDIESESVLVVSDGNGVLSPCAHRTEDPILPPRESILVSHQVHLYSDLTPTSFVDVTFRVSLGVPFCVEPAYVFDKSFRVPFEDIGSMSEQLRMALR